MTGFAGSHRARARRRRTRLVFALACALFPGLSFAEEAREAPGDPESARAEVLAEFAASAEWVFRGRCTGARPVQRRLAGARLAATTYSFEITEWLKGPDTRGELEFTQVGTPLGGPTDLGALVGLPTYEPGQEYVLFVLPSGASGLTSPAGAGEGAFLVLGEELHPVGSRHGLVRLPARREASGATAAPGLTLETVRDLFGLGDEP